VELLSNLRSMQGFRVMDEHEECVKYFLVEWRVKPTICGTAIDAP
jgi:hypothetical protein